MRMIVAAVVGGLLAAGCVGGNVFGANPADGGCGFRPEGLIVDDITGVWEGDGQAFTLKLGGVITGKATLLPPSPQPSASRGARSARPTKPSPSATGPSAGPTTVEATGHWTLRAETLHGDIEITGTRAAQGPASFGLGGLYVSGTRRQPWLYTLGDGDPDSCNIIKYERTSRG